MMIITNDKNISYKAALNIPAVTERAQTLYRKVRTDFNSENISREISLKAKELPISMQGFYYTPSAYLSQKIDVDNFIEIYFEFIANFFKRITLGKDSKLFSQTYSKEIQTIKDINVACNDFYQKRLSKADFDARIENLLDTASKISDKKEISFVI